MLIQKRKNQLIVYFRNSGHVYVLDFNSTELPRIIMNEIGMLN